MDNPNQNFPTFEDMQKSFKKPPHFMVAIVVILVVGLGVIWYFDQSNFDFIPAQIRRATISPEPEAQNQVNSIDVGDLDSEFQTVDKDLSSL